MPPEDEDMTYFKKRFFKALEKSVENVLLQAGSQNTEKKKESDIPVCEIS
jgi:hypothetical protein